jgi:hypothetical protein
VVILLAEEPPSLSMLSILEDGKYIGRIQYLRGSILNDRDLERCDSTRASAFFLLCNKDSVVPKSTDQATVLKAMAVKKHLHKMGADDILIIMQMILPDSRQFFSRSRYGESNHQIVCIDEIKLNLLAKSCICPGFSTMVSNLVRSSNLEASTTMDTWAQEYIVGCGKEIYRAKLSPFFSSKTFSEMANLVFSHLGVCVFAVEIMDASGVQRAVLYPPKYEIPSSSTYVFLIGEDVTDAHLVSSFTLQDGVFIPSGPVADTNLNAIGGHKDGVEGEGDNIEAQEVMIERLSKIYHYTHEPVDFESACHENLEDMTGHILVCGNMSSVQEFIKTLRSKHVPLQPVVLLFPSKPPAVLWQQLSRFPMVYYVQGNALEQCDLVRAGVLGVDKAVILAGASDADTDPSKQRGVKHARISEEAALGRLMDANSLFTFRSICTARPSANIVCQIRNSDNIKFLMVEDRENGSADDDITLCPPFAAGHVFLSSVLDRLTAQVQRGGRETERARERARATAQESQRARERESESAKERKSERARERENERTRERENERARARERERDRDSERANARAKE